MAANKNNRLAKLKNEPRSQSMDKQNRLEQILNVCIVISFPTYILGMFQIETSYELIFELTITLE